MKSLAFLSIGLAGGAFLNAPRGPVIEAKLTNVVVSTPHMDREVKFYSETLGYKSFFNNKTCTFMKTGSANLVFVKVQKASDETKRICLDVGVPDLDAARSALAKAGLKIDESQPQILKLHDPDGNLVEIVKG